jgi:hypothetical protein
VVAAVCRGLNFFYDPDTQGAAADWMLDLVNTGFPKPEVRE